METVRHCVLSQFKYCICVANSEIYCFNTHYNNLPLRLRKLLLKGSLSSYIPPTLMILANLGAALIHTASRVLSS